MCGVVDSVVPDMTGLGSQARIVPNPNNPNTSTAEEIPQSSDPLTAEKLLLQVIECYMLKYMITLLESILFLFYFMCVYVSVIFAISSYIYFLFFFLFYCVLVCEGELYECICWCSMQLR